MSKASKQRSITVRVLVHLTSDGQYAVGVVTGEWQGALRLDRRFARLRVVPEPDGRPPGVDIDIWRALRALEALVLEQSQASPPPP